MIATVKQLTKRTSKNVQDAIQNDEAVTNLAEVFRLLGDPTRIRVLLHLRRDGELNVGTLCERLELSQPLVSHHLALLREGNLIETRRDGKFNFYRIASPFARDLVDGLSEASNKLSRKPNVP